MRTSTVTATRPLADTARACSLGVLTLLALVGTGHAAGLAGSVVTVSLKSPGGIEGDPTPLAFVNTVTVGPGEEITAGDGSPIGSFMLSSELIDLQDTAINLRLFEGSSLGTTGYLGLGGAHARYEFTGLNLPGQVIQSLSFTVGDGFASGPGVFTGVSNLAALQTGGLVHLLSPNSLSLDLDTLAFADRGLGESLNHADIRISLHTAPVPEPEALTLLLCGLGVLAWRQGRPSHPRRPR